MECSEVLRLINHDKNIVDYLIALLTPTIAIFAVWVTSSQKKINQKQLKLKLFEKRYEYYSSVKTVLQTVTGPVTRDNYLTVETTIKKAIGDLGGFKFIFDEKLFMYIRDNVVLPSEEYLELEIKFRQGAQDNWDEYIKKQRKILAGLNETHSSIDTKFINFMSVSH